MSDEQRTRDILEGVEGHILPVAMPQKVNAGAEGHKLPVSPQAVKKAVQAATNNQKKN